MRMPGSKHLSFFMLICFCLIIGANSCAKSKKTVKWESIAVDVKASQAIHTSQKVTVEKNGLQRLDITLSNNGTQPATINSIEIRIPVPGKVSDDMKIAYGSSCMGQRPVFINKVGEPQENSYSYMYSMLRQSKYQYVFAGALSWRIFIPIFTFENNAFVVRSSGEGKLVKPGQSIKYEQIVFSSTADWQHLLNAFGSAIAIENGINKLKEADYKGWASWDYYAYKFSDKDIYENVELIKQIDPTANLIQIDAGWYSQRGDFTNSRTDIPGGMKAVADRIKSAGMTPGIWIDGFRANTDSEVFRKHPEFFLHDNEGNVIVQIRRPEGPDKDRVYIDYSHPGARAHIAECIRVITKEMGIPYIKIDFVRFGLNDEILAANSNFKSIKPYDTTITDVERLRIGLKTMREAAGVDCYLLGCSGVFGPMIGLVDGMRTGGDISPRFEAFPERVLANAGNFYLAGQVFNGDADYLVFREAADEDAGVSQEKVKNGGNLTINEAQMWADFNKFYGNFRLSSDKLTTLRPERRALVKNVFDFPMMDEMIPLDFWEHGKEKSDGYELLLARNGKDIYLGIFNWSSEPKEYDLATFESGLQTISARHSKVLKYTGSLSYAELSKSLSAGLTK